MVRLQAERKNDKRFTATNDRKSYISNSYPERSHPIDTEFFTASSIQNWWIFCVHQKFNVKK